MCRARALYGIICKERASGLSPYIIQPQESSKHTAGRADGTRRRKAAPAEVNKANININARGAQHKAGVHECSAEQTFVYDLLRCPPPLHLLALTCSLSLSDCLFNCGRAGTSRRPLHLLLRFLLDCNLVCSLRRPRKLVWLSLFVLAFCPSSELAKSDLTS
jgi:hypothetical protein